MKLLLVTDAWHPQVNGVVRTLGRVRDGLNAKGWRVHVLGPEGITVACPTYSEIRLTLQPQKYIRSALKDWQPDAIHIGTEGPLGWAMRAVCIERGWPFTTSFHTRFPDYIHGRFGIPPKWIYKVLRNFHSKAECVLVPTPSMTQELRQMGFANASVWTRGVDLERFHPKFRIALNYPRPIQLYVGRIAPEKNLNAFLSLDLGGTKLVVGDGPQKSELMRKFPNAIFLGPLFGSDLSAIYASSDVFVFPSKTDTFGLVMLEALASGTPVAAFPEPAPLDVLQDPAVASLNRDLGRAIQAALQCSRFDCREYAGRFSWQTCVDQFEKSLVLLSAPPDLDREAEWQSPFRSLPSSQYYSFT